MALETKTTATNLRLLSCLEIREVSPLTSFLQRARATGYGVTVARDRQNSKFPVFCLGKFKWGQSCEHPQRRTLINIEVTEHSALRVAQCPVLRWCYHSGANYIRGMRNAKFKALSYASLKSSQKRQADKRRKR